MDRMVMSSSVLSCLISAIASPLGQNSDLDLDVLKLLACYQLEKGVEGFYCNGSSGEGLLLTPQERRDALEAVLSVAEGRVPVITHVGALSTRDSIELAKHAADVGAEAISLTPPIYYRYSEQEIRGHYLAVLDAADIPLILYNIPQFTGRSLDPNDPLLDDPRVIGVKHTAHNLFELERMVTAHPEVAVINGFDETYLAATAAGAVGTIGTTVGIQIDRFKSVREALAKGDIVSAQKTQSEINDVINALVKVNVFPAAKWLESKLTGLPLGPCRKPFGTIDDAGAKALEPVVKALLKP